MNSKFKIAIVSAIAIVCVGGIVTYKIQENMKDRELQVNKSLAQIQDQLPAQIIQQNNFKAGWFSSVGQYTLTSTNKSSLVIDYQLSHPMTSWFSGKAQLNAQGKLSGEVTKDIDLAGKNLFEATGHISETTADINYLTPNMEVINKGKNVAIIGPGTGVIQHTNGNVKLDWKPTKISVGNDVNLNTIVVSRKFTTAAPELGEFNITIDNVASKLVQVNGIELLTNANLIDNKYNVFFDFNAKKINALNEKDGSAKLSYSIEKIDAASVNQLHALYKKYSTEVPAEAKKQAYNSFYNLLQSGFIFKTNLKAKGDKSSFNVLGEITLKPVEKTAPVSFSQNTKLALNLDLQGEITALASLYLSEYMVKDVSGIKVSGVYDSKGLIVNNQLFDNSLSANLKTILLDLDKSLEAAK